jgi:hypothetical protein
MFTKLITASKRTKLLALGLALAVLLTVGGANVSANVSAYISPSNQSGCVGQNIGWTFGTSGGQLPFHFVFDARSGGGPYIDETLDRNNDNTSYAYGSTGTYGQHLKVTDATHTSSNASSTVHINCQR